MQDLYACLIAFIFLISLLGIIVFQLMCLADLEFDYVNPYDASSRINNVVLFEFGLQGVLSFFYFVTGHWFMALLCAPYLYFNLNLYMNRDHLLYVTEIYNTLEPEKNRRSFKLGYLVALILILDDHECIRRRCIVVV